ARKRFQFLGINAIAALRTHRIEHTGATLQRNATARSLLDAVGLYLDVLLYLPRQLGAVGWKQPPQMAREDVSLLEIGVGEGQDLREEGVKPHVVGELPTAVVLLVLGEGAEALDYGGEHGVELVL